MSDLRTSIESGRPPRKKWPWLAAGAAREVVALGITWGVSASAVQSTTAAGAGSPVRGGTLEFGLLDYQRSPDTQLGTNYAESIIGNNVTDKLTWQDPKTGDITPPGWPSPETNWPNSPENASISATT